MTEKITTWVWIAYIILSAIVAFTPTFIAWKKAHKAKKNATTDAELAQADADEAIALNDMREQLDNLIVQAENTYNSVNAVLKQSGTSVGPLKKQMVLTGLQSFALAHGYNFDIDYWSNKIDTVVELTKQVNRN